MKIPLKELSISLLLIAGVCSHAEPRPADGRDAARFERQQPRADRNDQHGYQAEGGRYQGQAQGAPDNARQRMSPEQRQELRRSINEAGRDLYIRKPPR